MTDINSSLLITVTTDGFTALQPTSPLQYYTPATGQRAYTIQDAIGALNDQINANTDPTSVGGDSPDVLYNFLAESDGMILIDAASILSDNNLAVWDESFAYSQGAWQ